MVLGGGSLCSEVVLFKGVILGAEGARKAPVSRNTHTHVYRMSAAHVLFIVREQQLQQAPARPK